MNTAQKATRTTYWYYLAASAAAGVVYFTTLAPSVDRIDCGELAAVQATGGVAHPTGYPLFTLLGWLFSRLPFPGTVIFQLNFLAMLYVVTALLVFFFLAGAILSRYRSAPAKGKAATESSVQEPNALWNLLAILSGGWLLAFSRTWWDQATSTEVYSLQALCLALVLLTTVNAWKSGGTSHRPWLLLAAALGLSFGNHLTTLVLLPGIAYLYFLRNGFSRASWMRIARMLAVFFPVVILLYLWLPLRASADPALNWGNPTDWGMFKYHVSGAQFQVWLFTGMEAFTTKFKAFFGSFPSEFAYAGLLAGLGGLVYSFMKDRKLAIFLLLIFLGDVLYVCNYNINDLEPYFLPAILAWGVWMVLGVRWLLITVKQQAAQRWAALAAVAASVVFACFFHYGHNNKSDLWQYDKTSRAMLASVEKNALVLTYQWDAFVSPSLYLQQVEQVRPDVMLLEYKIMRDRLWYVNHIRRNDPQLYNLYQNAFDKFASELAPFYFGEEYNPRTLTHSFDALMMAVLSEAKRRPVYIAAELVKGEMANKMLLLPQGFHLVPEAYFYRLLPDSDTAYRPCAIPKDDFGLPPFSADEHYITHNMRLSLAIVWQDRAMYEASQGKMAEASAWKKAVTEKYPAFAFAPQLQQIP